MKVRLCGKRLYATASVKYLRLKLDVNLSWQCQINELSIKLNRANALSRVSKVIDVIGKKEIATENTIKLNLYFAQYVECNNVILNKKQI